MKSTLTKNRSFKEWALIQDLFHPVIRRIPVIRGRFISLVLIVLLLAGNYSLRADEGMWIPLLLNKNYAEMQRLGLRLTPEQLYSLNNSSLKDAIVVLDRGSCSGSIISSMGLLLTNHHCAYGEIQDHSTPEANYLNDGFWAQTLEEELPNPDKTASFLIRIEDVTNDVLEGITPDMPLTVRDSIISANTDRIEEESVEDTHYEAHVMEMFHGSEFYLYVYEVFTDIRLVGAPPSSIGKFGGDTDNWMWPRHTGDFTLFRVYTGPDGKPAPYSKENIPLVPKHHLPVSIKNFEEHDFAMIWGFPGITDRYRTSHGIQLNIDQIDPTGSELRRAKMDAMKPFMDEDVALKIMYADKYAYLGNFWKKSAEQRKALIALDVVGEKQKQEEEFMNWVNQSRDRIEIYGNVMDDIAKAYRIINDNKYEHFITCFFEAFIDPQIIFNAFRSSGFLTMINSGIPKDEAAKRLRDRSEEFYTAFDPDIEMAIFATMMENLYERLDERYIPDFLEKAASRYKGDWQRYAERVFRRSIFASEEAFDAFLDRPRPRKFRRDPALQIMQELLTLYRETLQEKSEANDLLRNANRLYIQGLREMHPDKLFYPDANSSMRMNYGKVLSYFPRDGVFYHYITYLDGVMEKEIPGDEEFDVHPKLKELYKNQDYGLYGINGRMPVNFLTDNDITGGNSGSAVINAYGEVIGTAFDGNSEAMSSDLQFNPDLQRTIICDMRYVLFIIDKFAEAHNLIEEMDIVK